MHYCRICRDFYHHHIFLFQQKVQYMIQVPSRKLYQYYHCTSGNLCKTLWENKLYPCARATLLIFQQTGQQSCEIFQVAGSFCNQYSRDNESKYIPDRQFHQAVPGGTA